MEIIGGSIIGFLHVFAAVAIIGGSFFMKNVLDPSTKGLEPPIAGKINQSVGMRFTIIAWVGLLVLLITGLIRVFGTGKVTLDNILSEPYGQVLIIKIILFAIATGIAVAITVNGKKLGELAQQIPPSVQEMAIAQGKIKTFSTINLNLGIIIIFLAVIMRFLNS